MIGTNLCCVRPAKGNLRVGSLSRFPCLVFSFARWQLPLISRALLISGLSRAVFSATVESCTAEKYLHSRKKSQKKDEGEITIGRGKGKGGRKTRGVH